MELTTINGTIKIDLDTIALDDINDIISKFSVEGPTGAKTVLYSGTLGGCSTNTIVKKMSNVRIIDNTELGIFLADNSKNSQFIQLLKSAIRNEIAEGTFDITKVEKGLYANDLEDLSKLLINKSELYGDNLEEAIYLAIRGYLYEPTQGAWAIASKRFIEETPTDSEIICITAEANNTRTWAAVEVPTALDTLPDEQKFGGYTIGELKQIRDSEGIEKVVDILKQESAEITDDIQLYYDKNGTLLTTDSSSITGGNAVEIPNDTAFSTTMGDVRNYADSNYMSTICPEYDNLTDLQKLQLQQIELDARNHDFTKLQQTISGDKTGGVGDVRITYDVEGKVTGIDMSGIRQGSAISAEGSSAVFDISSDGTTKVRLDSPAETRAWWRNETPSIINNEKVGSINGVDAQQFRNAYKNYSSVNHPNIDESIGQAIDKIPPTNTDGNALAKGIYEGNNSIGFSDGTMETSNGTMNLSHNSKAARLGKTLDFMGVAADAADAYRTYKTAYAQMEAGDFEGADDTIGSYICTTILGTIGATMGSLAAEILITAGIVSGPVGWLIILCGGVLYGAIGKEIWDDYLDPLSAEYDAAGNANPPRDPLVIDLGGLGIELTTLENGVYFDLDKNGFAEKTAWIGKEEGFLVLDRNKDGKITDGGELFGDRVELENGLISVSGFQALSELDDNKDGMVDSNDSMWNQLRVWIDKDQNGVSEGELKTLEELGIISISLNVFKDANVDSETGTMEAEYAMVTFADGTQRKISEFWFPVNASDTQQNTQDGETIKTIGNVPDIFIAIEQDKTGRLSELYEKFVASKDFIEKRYLTKEILYFLTNSKEIEPNSRGGNVDARDLHVIETFMGRDFFGVTGANPNVNAAAILKDMMISIENMYFNYLNANTVDGMYVNTIGSNTDENGNITLDFSIFNMLLEDKIVCGENVDSLIYSIAAYLVGYDEINGTTGYAEFNQYCTELSTHYGTLVEFAKSANTYLGTEDNNGFWGTDNNDFVFGFEGNDSFNGVAGNDVLVGGKGNDTLHGENGDDILYGGEGNDTLGGGYGNDHLYGGEGDDTLDGSYGENHLYGGAGNDTFTGIYGSDTYHFEAGDGQDIIETYNGHHNWNRNDDKIVFGESVKKEDITAKKVGYNLILENKSTGDSITIENAYSYSDGRWHIKDISFANGDVLTVEEIETIIRERGIQGTENNDTIYGVSTSYGYSDSEILHGHGGNDTLYGNDGDDILYGGEGDDTLDGGYGANHLYGGKGNDILTGLYGDDTYHFEAGDGQDIIQMNTTNSIYNHNTDRIVFGESVKKEDITARRENNNLILENKVTGDTITVEKAYNFGNGQWTIKDISFANGDVLTEEDIKSMIRANGLHGTENNDTIYGISANYAYTNNEILYGHGGNDSLYGQDGDDILYGGEGDDTLDGGYGANHLYGGKGNDILTGLYGDDTYHFEAGDGQDIIQMNTTNSIYNHNTDRIVFGESVKKEDITARRENNNLILENKVTGDTITIEKAYNFSNGQWTIKDISFANGEVLTEEDIKELIRANGIHGTDDNDTIYGISANYAYTNNEILYGHGGNDSLYGQDGDDILYGGEGADTLDGGYGANHLYGGKGNDILTGLYGDDTYHFEAGDGQDIIQMNTTNSIYNHNTDRIVFGESVKKEDITARRENNNLILENKVTGDTITIEKAYNFGNGQWTIKDISFENGDVLTEEDIKELIRANGIHGTDGNDTICGLTDMYGYSANEIIDGGEGDDTLYGNSGDDIYIFEQGDGQDKISDRYGNNTISFGEGITADNLLITTQNYDVAINFTDSEDMITLMDALRNDAYKNFELTFMDGMIGAIDLSGETDNQIHVIREAETQAETVTDMVATELPSEVQTDTQVLQMVDVMNTGSGENVSAVEATEPVNTVEEMLLFVEQ